MIIQIQNRQRKVSVQRLKPCIEQAIQTALSEEKISRFFEKKSVDPVFSITLTNNRQIREMNRQYRERDCATDVLSFPQQDGGGKILTRVPKNELFRNRKGRWELCLGDIVISVEKAGEQACALGHSLEREVAFLTVHSVLHLLGYDHIEPDDETKMLRRQRKIIRHYESLEGKTL